MCDERGHRQYGDEEIKTALVRAAGRFVDRDLNLLERALYEPALTHRLAVYLERRFPTHDVDCEYDRDGDGPKDVAEYGNARPDIIVHCRGHNHPWNLLAVEAKWAGTSYYLDKRKLRGLKNPNGRFAYQVVALVVLGEASVLVDFGTEQRLVPRNGPVVRPTPRGGWLNPA
jgi:hypothetical protein